VRVHLRVQSEPLSALGELFEIHTVPGRPSWLSIVFSIGFHSAVVLCLALVHFPVSDTPQRKISKEFPPTEVKIGEKLYYVTRLPILPRATTELRHAPNPSQGSPHRAVKKAGHASSGGATQVAEAVVSEAPAAARPAPRVFVPPEIRRDTVAERTLIQPDSPPDLIPPDTNLPSFRTWAMPMPKIAKQFVAPGNAPKPPPPEAPPVLAAPNLNLAAAAPAPPKTNPAIVLPLAPPPIDAPDLPADSVLAITQGDPVKILSVTRNPVLPVSTLVVPAGNIAGIVGKEAGAGVQGGAGTGPGNSVSKAGTGAKGNPGSGSGSGSDSGLGVGSGIAAGNLRGTGSSAGSGGGAGGTGIGTGAGAATGTGTEAGGRAKNVVILRPATGNFDAVVVQSSPLDILPGRKDLLSGRPVYTVYIPVGTAKDWTLYFCVPEEARPRAAPSTVVSLAPAPPVMAPYPTRIIRPLVSLPSYQKFMLVHGFVSAAGRVERLKVVDPGERSVDDAMLTSLIEWEFRPATRDGQPIAVEFLLAIAQISL